MATTERIVTAVNTEDDSRSYSWSISFPEDDWELRQGGATCTLAVYSMTDDTEESELVMTFARAADGWTRVIPMKLCQSCIRSYIGKYFQEEIEKFALRAEELEKEGNQTKG